MNRTCSLILASLLLLAAVPAPAQRGELLYRQSDQLVVQTPDEEIVVADKAVFKVFLQNTMNRAVPDVTLSAQSKAFTITIAPEKVSLPKEHRTYFDITLVPRPGTKPGPQQIRFRLMSARQLIQEFSVSVTVEPPPEPEPQPTPVPVEPTPQPPASAAPPPAALHPPPPAPSHPPASRPQQAPPKSEAPVFEESKHLMARPAAATPQVDGQLDEPSWKTAAALTGFATTTGAPPAFATTGMLLHDRNGLFLGLSCDDEDTALLTDQDTIEVLLTRMPNAKPAFRLTLSPTGRVQWRRILADGKDAPWAVSGIQFATEKTKRAWTLELFVPFAAMGMRPPSAPERWFVRVTRTKATGTKETSVWAPVPSDNRPSPPGFGEVILTPIALPPSGPPLQSEAAPQPAPEPAPAPEPDQDAMP